MKDFTRKLYAAAAAFCLASCGAVQPWYVEGPPAKPKGALQVNYFFDRTDSVGGFVQDGKETGYDKAIYSALDTSDTLGYGEPAFYEFGESDTRKLDFDSLAMRREITKKSYYAGRTDSPPSVVKKNNGQPFSAVSEYIKSETGKNSLNILVTDLYEQYGANKSFHLLFQNAFNQKLSGALFAIKGEFLGNIHSVSTANESIYGVNGFSTFFILMTGNQYYVKEYCKAFAGQLSKKNISFNKTIFVLGESANVDGRVKAAMTKANRAEQFDAGENKTASVNLLTLKDGFIKRWVRKENSFAGVDVKAECYAPTSSGAGAKFLYKIKAQSDKSVLPVVQNFGVEYFSGAKTQPGKVSVFEKAASNMEGFEMPSVFSAGKYECISLKIMSGQLKKGCYRVRFNIVPDWVTAESASDVGELKESNVRGERVKVLNFHLIYDNILNEFAKAGGSSEIFYLVNN